MALQVLPLELYVVLLLWLVLTVPVAIFVVAFLKRNRRTRDAELEAI